MTQYHSVKLFEEKKIRSSWDAESETWYYSVVNVVGILTEQPDSRRAAKYWSVLKSRLSNLAQRVSLILRLLFHTVLSIDSSRHFSYLLPNIH